MVPSLHLPLVWLLLSLTGLLASCPRDLGAEPALDLHDTSRLRRAGVFGLIYFQLRDDPAHLGYFGAAERHFGLLRADGKAKPAFEVFRALGR